MKPEGRALSRLRAQLPGGWVVPATCVVALLHFGQDVLQPLTLAAILGLVIDPLVRRMRRLGLSRGMAATASVALVGSGLLAIAAVLAVQLAAVASELPRYRAGMLQKIEQVRDQAVRPLEKWRAELGIAPPSAERPSALPAGATTPAAAAAPARTALDPAAEPVPRLLRLVWQALAECGIVLVLLVFILLDPDALRDRVLRLAGRAELAQALQTLADAASGVSRFFLAQFLVNLCFGAVVAAALWFIGIPHALLFGALAAVLRFLPYLGILAAGIGIVGFAAAIDPGWSLVLQAACVLVAAELVLANAIEPRVYGHTSGLAPVAIIVSALFWSAVWGPVGLVLSTPLTLCLVVAGRHVRALEPVAIFFGDSPGITQGERLYHRALAGELRDIHEDARSYLRRRGLASYCDHVLLPAIALARADERAGRLQEARLQGLRRALVGLVEALTGGAAGRPRRIQATVLEANVGAHLRRIREARLGRRQGPLHAPGSVVLCTSLGTERDEYEAELLVLALADAGLDARSVTLPTRPSGGEAMEAGVARRAATVFVAYPHEADVPQWTGACRKLRAHLPGAALVTIRTALDPRLTDEAAVAAEVDLVLRSFAEALAFARRGAADRIRTERRPDRDDFQDGGE